MRIGVTGAGGFLGWHVRCYIHSSGEHEIVPALRETFLSRESLDEFVEHSDAIVHTAGVNRASDDELERTNTWLADQLVASFERTGARPAVAYANSVQIDRDNAYARGKRAAGERLASWASRGENAFTDVVLPNLYGEGGRPFYNSVVATFAWQLANDATPAIENDSTIELLYAQDAAHELVAAVTDPADDVGQTRPRGMPVTLSELKKALEELAHAYLRRGTFPVFESKLRLRLFNTMRWNLPPEHWPQPLKGHSDERGSFYEIVRAENGGQTSISTTKPGITRGDHFHFGKVERFLVLEGDAVIRWRRLWDGAVQEFRVSGTDPAFVDIPTLHAHNITNVGDGELLTLFWSHEPFDPANPDTFAEPV